MGLSSFLQSPTIMGEARRRGLSFLRHAILDEGTRWFDEHPEEARLVAKNLALFGLPNAVDRVRAVQKHVFLHYYEKLMPLCCTPREYSRYVSERVDTASSVEQIRHIRRGGKAVLVPVAHFGAVELVAPALALAGLPVTGAVRFATEQFSRMAHERARLLSEDGGFGTIRFVEVGKPGTAAALEMAAVIRRGEVLLSVFDERTEYSIPCELLGRTVWGGAGLDRLIKFCGAPLSVAVAFMVRTDDESYQMSVEELPIDGKGTVQAMFGRLEEKVRKHPEQWYFLHEEIPVVDPGA